METEKDHNHMQDSMALITDSKLIQSYLYTLGSKGVVGKSQKGARVWEE